MTEETRIKIAMLKMEGFHFSEKLAEVLLELWAQNAALQVQVEELRKAVERADDWSTERR